MASRPIYQFYSELAGFEPKIWRRFQVAGNSTIARLGYVVMTLYEMEGSHLFSVDFPIDENLERELAGIPSFHPAPPEERRVEHYEVLPEESFLDASHRHRVCDATEMTLTQLSRSPGLLLRVMYDFGDGWEVTLRLEDIIKNKALPGRELPRVLAGKGFGIIEDCGGPRGLARLAQAFREKAGEDYEELSSWLGQEDLDLTAFDLEDMNYRLKRVPRIYRDLYEYGYAPTERSLKLLDRAYLKK